MQTIYFIRHGEGYHNIGVLNEDAHLTDMGWRQAEALRQHMGNMRPPPDIQVALLLQAPLRAFASLSFPAKNDNIQFVSASCG